MSPVLHEAWAQKSKNNMNITIRRVYLYLTSFIGLVLILIGSVQLLNLALKTWIFTKADDQFFYGPCYERSVAPVKVGEEPKMLSEQECEAQRNEERSARRQNQGAEAVAMILVGTPVWIYHWRKVKDDKDATNV